MTLDYGGTQITAADKGIKVYVPGDGLRAVQRAFMCRVPSALYLKVTSNVSPSALIAPGVELLLS